MITDIVLFVIGLGGGAIAGIRGMLVERRRQHQNMLRYLREAPEPRALIARMARDEIRAARDAK